MKKHIISKKGTVHIKSGALRHGRSSMLKLEQHAHRAHNHHDTAYIGGAGYGSGASRRQEEKNEHARAQDTNLERLKESLASMNLGHGSGKRYVKF